MNSSHRPGHPLPPYAAPLYDTTALTSALANPYAHHHHHAYAQAYSPRPPTTADGYTLSSTYVPDTANHNHRTTATVSAQSHSGRPPAQSQTAVKPILNHLTYGSWYQPGNCRCTRPGCTFTGSRKSVEVHMMDRHFIFPHGWEKRSDWDADPSLRGKPIAIQGTSVTLDTPEAINAWIAERRRRFPTDDKVRDKKRKLEEAAARGQLTLEDIGAGARKKRKQNVAPAGGSRTLKGRGQQRGRGRRHQAVERCEESRTENADDPTGQPADTTAKCAWETGPASGSAADDDDEAPEVVSSKIPMTPLCTPKVDVEKGSEVQTSHAPPQECPRRISQPKKPPRNPFASRSTLLRNLLLPEIRITISNLSQVVRFLVENDFLRDVELRPGEAQEQMIEVLGSSDTQGSARAPTKRTFEPSTGELHAG